jgi:hypothetical protein
VSPTTINKDLRHLWAALKKAKRWTYLAEVPGFDLKKEHKRLVTYVTADHFAAIYAARDTALMPEGFPYPPADWWRAWW